MYPAGPEGWEVLFLPPTSEGWEVWAIPQNKPEEIFSERRRLVAMMAHPDEASKCGEILHKRGIACVDRTVLEEAHCYHSLFIVTKHEDEKPSSGGYLGESLKKPPDDGCNT